MRRYHTLSAHLRTRFSCRVQKVPLDAGFTCPNRDGTLSTSGCVFCPPSGSGTGLLNRGLSLDAQWREWTARLSRRYGAKAFMAYLQSYSNTHGPVEKLRHVLSRLQDFPKLVGLSIGTRPDCLDAEKIACIAEFPGREIWLEIGLQSAVPETLLRINRGHDLSCFDHAVHLAHAAGIRTCVHLIIGLPGEDLSHVLRTVDHVNALPVSGVKFHNLYIAAGSVLSGWYEQGRCRLPDRETYVGWLVRALARLRPDILIHRLNADPEPGSCLAPAWAERKSELLALIERTLESENVRQGDTWRPMNRCPEAVPCSSNT